jgi:hypothetical protein
MELRVRSSRRDGAVAVLARDPAEFGVLFETALFDTELFDTELLETELLAEER